jgi:hypothetical protein
MRDLLIGRFYFKKTDHGNLIGEYSNRHGNESRVFAEAASRMTTGTGWIGKYLSSWHESPRGPAEWAELSIKRKPGNSGVFVLSWKRGNEELFVGEAMQCDGMLVGDYSDAAE